MCKWVCGGVVLSIGGGEGERGDAYLNEEGSRSIVIYVSPPRV